MKTIFKTLAFVMFGILILSQIMEAQQIHGIVKSKTSTIHFEEFAYGNTSFTGEIHSNLSGSKYTVNLKNGSDELIGVIKDKFLKFIIDLSYNNQAIEGEIKRSTNGIKEVWDVMVLDTHLSGTVVNNTLNTADIYNLTYGDKKIEGKIYKKVSSLVYELQFGGKSISGNMAYNISSVKHTYNIMGEGLSDDEFAVFLFMESVKLLKERVSEIDEFQGDN